MNRFLVVSLAIQCIAASPLVMDSSFQTSSVKFEEDAPTSDLNIFGEWVHNASNLHERFHEAHPYPHVVIPGFLNPKVASTLEHNFPPLSDPRWFQYRNPIEKKFAMDSLPSLYASVVDALYSDAFVQVIRQISSIQNAEPDPLLHGGGLHYHPRGGKLDMHLDYSIHPKTGKQRRLNLILFLNGDWNPAWGGSLELWDANFTHAAASLPPFFNHAVLFRTSDTSYHGLPTPIACPPGVGRKSLAVYYVSDPTPSASVRYKAVFRPLPYQPVPPGLEALYRIRESRVITQADLDKEFPDWETSEYRGEFW